MLAAGYSGRLASVSADGYPYCVPLLYICVDGKLYLHTTSVRGHLRRNVESDARVCFEVDECNGVFDYGRFECDSGLAFRSVVLFGKNLHRQSETVQAALLRRADGQVRKVGDCETQEFLSAHRCHHRLCHNCRAHYGQGTSSSSHIRAVACQGQDQDPRSAGSLVDIAKPGSLAVAGHQRESVAANDHQAARTQWASLMRFKPKKVPGSQPHADQTLPLASEPDRIAWLALSSACRGA
jgi:nitroimidazol reductase NimA-like FMN-containing flavoprotein (pyridoxamine 5'-phosphate oxidase superfamily)